MFQYDSPKRKQTKEKFTGNTQNWQPPSIHATGIPFQMQRHFEGISGFSLADVQVSYNSNRSAQLNVLAHTQRNRAYIAPKQERCLSYELGYIVPQKQEFSEELSHSQNSDTLQLYCGSEVYTSESGSNLLHYIGKDAPDGGMPNEGVPSNTGISILYEVIAQKHDVPALVDNFRKTFKVADPKHQRLDVALSIVSNQCTPSSSFQPSPETTANPLVHVEEVAWGYKNPSDNKSTASIHPPYYNLRRRASINPMAARFSDILSQNSNSLWHRLADSDIRFEKGNEGEQKENTAIKNQMSELVNISANPNGTKMVTFGYILTTPDNDYGDALNKNNVYSHMSKNNKERVLKAVKTAIDPFVDYLYVKEAEFRQHLQTVADLNIQPYPSEPSTYYRTESSTDNSAVWKIHSAHSSPQISEGMGLYKSLIREQGGRHQFLSTPLALQKTSAGKRHAELIQTLLNDYVIDSTNKQIHLQFKDEELFCCIKKLNQSYFNPDTHGLTTTTEENQRKYNRFQTEADMFLLRSEYVKKITRIINY